MRGAHTKRKVFRFMHGPEFNQDFTLLFRLCDFARAAQPAPFPTVSSSESPGFARRSFARRW
jgi:hypothetical protein